MRSERAQRPRAPPHSGGDLGQAVDGALEQPRVALADVGGQTRARKVERVDDRQRGGASRAARSQVARKVAPKVLAAVDAREKRAPERVHARKRRRAGGEVARHRGDIAAPQRQHALLRGDAPQRVDQARVPRPRGRRRGGAVLHLQQQLHALQRRHGRLGQHARSAAGGEVFQEARRVLG